MKQRYMERIAVKVACSMALLSGVALANTVLEQDDFESYGTGAFSSQGNWTIGAGTTGTIIGSGAAEGSKALQLAENTDTVDAALAVGGTKGLVYFRLMAKVTPSVNDSATEGIGLNSANAAFYINNSGEIKACTNGTWSVVSTIPSFSASTWYAFIVHLDYVNETYSIYLGDNGGNSTVWTAQNAAPLPFATSEASGTFNQFEVAGEVSIDGISALEAFLENQTALDASPLNTETASATLGTTQTFRIPTHTYTGGDATLSGALGNILAEGLVVGDQIRVYTEANEFVTATLQSGGTWSASSTTDPLEPGQAYWLIPVSTRTVLSVYTDGLSPTEQATDTVTMGGIDGVDLYGTGTAGLGWTAVVWTKGTTKTLSDAGLNETYVNGDLAGARCYSVPQGSKAFYASRWDDAAQKWKFLYSNSDSADTLVQGDTVWVYQNNGATLQWQVQ